MKKPFDEPGMNNLAEKALLLCRLIHKYDPSFYCSGHIPDIPSAADRHLHAGDLTTDQPLSLWGEQY